VYLFAISLRSFDPLDGSSSTCRCILLILVAGKPLPEPSLTYNCSIPLPYFLTLPLAVIDTNFSVGTIFGVWPGSKFIGQTGRQLVCGGMAVYGPRTTMTLAIDGVDGAHEFLLIDDFSAKHGQWIHTNVFSVVNEGKLFAPGNMRAAQDNPGYQALLTHYFDEKYQLRYTGGMVPDVNQILVKGKGVFCNPASKSAKAKLRVLYEVLPIAYVMEKGGAMSSNGSGSCLDIKVGACEDRSQVCYGSAGEVSRFEEMVGSKYAVEA
jgi:sedoheptulose-bisphosphatase